MPMMLKVGTTMRSGGYEQENGVPKDMLQELLSADEAYCELPFCMKMPEEGNSEIWNGVMDVVYKKDGKWHIIDYKTNADADDLDKKYQEQLNAYIAALKENFIKLMDERCERLFGL